MRSGRDRLSAPVPARARIHAVIGTLVFALCAQGTVVAATEATARTDIDASTEARDAGAPKAAVSPRAGLEVFRPGEADEADSDLERRIRLGRIQRANGEWLTAIRTLQQALDEVRDEHGQWDMRNVSVLTELAAAQEGLGNLQEAVGLYQQARHVNRVELGLHDPSQIPILDRLTEVHVRLSDYETANQLQEYAYFVQSRFHGDASPKVLPALYRLAAWWRRTGNIFSARGLYEQAIAIIEANYGPEDIRLVDALSGLATTYRLERYPTRPLLQSREEENFQLTTGRSQADPFPEDSRVRLNRYGEGEEALARIVSIIEARPDVTARERAQALLDLADWQLVFDKWTASFENYGRARDVLVADGWDEARMQGLFGEPTPLVFPLPDPPRVPAYAGEIIEFEGFVDLTYDITDRGRVRSVDVVASDPEGLMDFRTRKALKAARFRPRFVDGEPVETNGVEYRHRFVYYRREDEASDASADSVPQSETTPSAAPVEQSGD